MEAGIYMFQNLFETLRMWFLTVICEQYTCN